MPGDGRWVDVVLSEGTYEGLRQGADAVYTRSSGEGGGDQLAESSLPFQRWAGPPSPRCRPPSEPAPKRSPP